MYSRDELFLCSLECYFGVYFPSCEAMREISTKMTLSWAQKQFGSQVHTLFSIYAHKRCFIVCPWRWDIKGVSVVQNPTFILYFTLSYILYVISCYLLCYNEVRLYFLKITVGGCQRYCIRKWPLVLWFCMYVCTYIVCMFLYMI